MRSESNDERVKLGNDAEFMPRWRVIAAISTSVVADILDYLVAPVFTVPLIGDVPDAFFVAALYLITKSKISAAINLIEFLPIVGDLSPTYTLSTLLWLYRQRWVTQKSSPNKEKRGI